ncbi:MAG: DUF523 and DUF1722 domain-containing protein [Candidatus Eisenbacteria bacterium]|nr:DUF523 and DUF1722 domain-containing protein [Candidatus Eisenbacteria bacterium]
MAAEKDPPIRIGISACLLGREVRYDGGHKRDGFLVDTFGAYVEWVTFCPEVELGLGTPRDPIRLVREKRGADVRLVVPKTGRDLTDNMRAFAKRRVAKLRADDLCGFVLKKNSPSCGMARVKVYDHNGAPSPEGVGLFAAAVMERFPNLPVEEEGRLSDPRLRENFVERVFAYRRLRTLFEGRFRPGALVKFHTAHKLALLAHSTAAYTELGRLVARAREVPPAGLRDRYEAGFMQAMKKIATPRQHTNVLQHMAGYFKKDLGEAEKRELGAIIEDYRRGLVPLVVPLTLIRHHVRRHQVEYLEGQTYLQPHPRELMLRNHV